MSLTANPASRSAAAVPPVETSSTPNPASALASSTSPVLSVTLSSARRIGFSARGELSFSPCGLRSLWPFNLRSAKTKQQTTTTGGWVAIVMGPIGKRSWCTA